jgi:hypothetical protein
MNHSLTYPDLWWAFDATAPGMLKRLLTAHQQAPAEQPEKRLCCKICGQMITRDQDRIKKGGAHTHTFTNLYGIRFAIGCFKTVAGCEEKGRKTDEFTWFPGFAWRIAYCTGCKEHLGWGFHSQGDDIFYGLILNRLSYPH